MKQTKNLLGDNVIWDIYQDKNQLLWISTDTGLHTLILTADSKAKPRFNSVKITDFTGTLSEVKTIFQDENYNYWFGSYDNGIHLTNKNLTYIGSLQSKNRFDLHIQANTLFDIKEINNQLWLATDNGLFIINHHYELSSHLSTQDISKDSSNNDVNIKTKQTLLSNHIRAIVQYDDNNVWLATDKGLNVVNVLNDNVSSYQNNSYSTSLSESWLMAIFKDRNDTIWLGSYGGGLNEYSPLSAKLYHGLSELDFKNKQNFRVESFTQARDGTIYLSTEQQGFFKVDGKSISKVSSKIPNNLNQVIKGDDNYLWLITRQNKLYKYNLTADRLIEQINWHKKSEYSIINPIFFIKNNLWYINKKGNLSQYQTKENKFTHFPFKDNNTLINLQKDNNGFLWLTTNDNKVISFDTVKRKFTEGQFNLSNDFHSKNITSLAIGTRYIWLGSDSQGITLIDKNNQKTTSFNESSGLENNFVASILIDDKNNAWGG